MSYEFCCSLTLWRIDGCTWSFVWIACYELVIVYKISNFCLFSENNERAGASSDHRKASVVLSDPRLTWTHLLIEVVLKVWCRGGTAEKGCWCTDSCVQAALLVKCKYANSPFSPSRGTACRYDGAHFIYSSLLWPIVEPTSWLKSFRLGVQ